VVDEGVRNSVVIQHEHIAVDILGLQELSNELGIRAVGEDDEPGISDQNWFVGIGAVREDDKPGNFKSKLVRQNSN
jgi:hypothetical protein